MAHREGSKYFSRIGVLPTSEFQFIKWYKVVVVGNYELEEFWGLNGEEGRTRRDTFSGYNLWVALPTRSHFHLCLLCSDLLYYVCVEYLYVFETFFKRHYKLFPRKELKRSGAFNVYGTSSSSKVHVWNFSTTTRMMEMFRMAVERRGRGTIPFPWLYLLLTYLFFIFWGKNSTVE